MLNILIADDNKQIAVILSQYAKKEGYQVYCAYNGEEALELFYQNHFDMVLLDVMMPKMDGFQVCREIRKKSNVPVIMITARGEDFERIMGLDIGADDYIVKPFSPGEVMARVRAILRRIGKGASANCLHIENLKIDIENYLVSVNNTELPLTKKETELLWTLASNQNKAYSRDHLLDMIWGFDYIGDSRTVDSHIKRLRAKLDQIPHPKWEIKTIWGVGYKFEVELDEE